MVPLSWRGNCYPVKPPQRYLSARGVSRALGGLGCVAAVLTGCLVSAAPIEQIQYSSDVDDYRITYDSTKLVGYDMPQIVWLSPWYHPDTPGPFMTAWSETARGVDKIFFIPNLELGISMDESREFTFELRAGQNLAWGRQELETLKRMALPPTLEPVRKYLSDNLQYLLRVAQVRFEYIKTGDVGPMRRALCEACTCGHEEHATTANLKNVPDYVGRVQRSNVDWHNTMLKCYNTTHGIYPIPPWESFLREFDIHEYHRNKSPE